MAELSIINPEKPFKFKQNPKIKLKNSTEFNNLNQTPSTKLIDFFKKVNLQGLQLVESPENSLGFDKRNTGTEELGESLLSKSSGLPMPDSSFIPRTLSPMATSVNNSTDAKPETGHLPRLISVSSGAIRTVCAIRKCPVRKLADVDPGNGNMPYPNGAVHHQAVGVHENGVHAAGNENQNDGENGNHHDGENGNANDEENGNGNDDEDGGNGNGNGGNPAVVFQPQFRWHAPIVIQRYESNVNDRRQVVRGEDVHTNIFARDYNSWEAITAAIRQVWRQITINNPININDPDMDEMNPYYDSWPECVADFGWHNPITGHFVHYDPDLFEWLTVRHFVANVVVHGEIGFANVGDLGANINGNGGNVDLLQQPQFNRFPAISIQRFEWALNNPNNVHPQAPIYTNIFANRYDSWQAFSAAIRQLWQQVTNNNNVNAPEIEAMNPNSDTWPGCATDIGFLNQTTGQFIRFDWQVNPWLNIRDFVTAIVVHGQDVEH